ncbi:sensor histidine kinase [Clavibacter zhangzhiyongii]|uniref:histidine kinase n=1 Tax=Clavibacter zhangzhiyongii TaxID=2768071 RepID=A0A7L7Z3Y9_9MICO|nr:HAMP domain-containing sensor histidine kinase [Clavibacter zhangzhiyongii]QOD44474.1 HAMP domain-containing histidine kinase [Clavibacter zhangzhiyongii]
MARAVEGDAVARPRLDRVIRGLLGVVVIANIVYLAALLLPGDPGIVLVDVGLSLALQWIPVVVFWLVAARTGSRRAEVVLAAAAVTANAAGDTIYVIGMDASGMLPSPSAADVAYLLFYPLMLLALVVLVRRRSRRTTKAVFLDAGLAVLGSAAVLAVILDPVLSDATSGRTVVAGAIDALYPAFDIVLVAVVVGIAASPVLRMGPRWQFLVLGLLAITGADIAYALLIREGGYGDGTPLDVAWTAGIACLALWVEGVDRAPADAPEPYRPTARLLPVPAMAVLAGLGVLLVATTTPVPPLALVLAASAVALSALPVMFRQAMLTRMLDGQERVVARLEALDRSKSDIIGTVSHEMRTPLTSISGYVELVLDGEGGDVPDDAKDMLRVVDRNARRLQSLVADMLTMTRLDAGERPAMAPLDVATLVRRAAESLRPFADARRVDLAVGDAGPATVEGDAGQLERVLTNVIENAVKFTPAGGTVSVELHAATGPTGRPAVMVVVADTGMGIPADALPQVFDRFFRAANALSEVVPGTGLGLAIVREIVQAHGGEVTVSSVLGEGTTFRIALPAQRGAGARG